MTRPIPLDSEPLSLLAMKKRTPTAVACEAWADAVLAAGSQIVIPEIIDYEVRRELNRLKRTGSIRRLERLRLRFTFLPMTSAMYLHAAELWADARNRGLPTVSPDALDIDVLLAAQSLSLGDPNTIVATSNPAHLGQFVAAARWQDIPP